MKFLTFLIILLLLSRDCGAQIFFNGNTRHAVKRSLSSYIKKEKLNANISETEYTLLYQFRDSAIQDMDYYFQFSKRGRCDKEIITLSCDSCFQKFKQSLIGNSYLRKIQINDTLFYGYYPFQHIMEIKIRRNFLLEVSTSSISKHTFREMQKSNPFKLVGEQK